MARPVRIPGRRSGSLSADGPALTLWRSSLEEHAHAVGFEKGASRGYVVLMLSNRPGACCPPKSCGAAHRGGVRTGAVGRFQALRSCVGAPHGGLTLRALADELPAPSRRPPTGRASPLSERSSARCSTPRGGVADRKDSAGCVLTTCA